MKNLIKFLVALLFLSGCGDNQKQLRLYLFETPDYCDYDDSLRVIYIKSHRQLQETKVVYFGDFDYNKPVYNAFGHKIISRVITSNEILPTTVRRKIEIDTTDPGYDITLHLHPGNDSILMITAPFELHNLSIVRYYMISTDQESDIFQFLDPLNMTGKVESDETTYMITLENYKDIDFSNGERVVLEYDTYKIPVPYQIFKN